MPNLNFISREQELNPTENPLGMRLQKVPVPKGADIIRGRGIKTLEMSPSQVLQIDVDRERNILGGANLQQMEERPMTMIFSQKGSGYAASPPVIGQQTNIGVNNM